MDRRRRSCSDPAVARAAVHSKDISLARTRSAEQRRRFYSTRLACLLRSAEPARTRFRQLAPDSPTAYAGAPGRSLRAREPTAFVSSDTFGHTELRWAVVGCSPAAEPSPSDEPPRPGAVKENGHRQDQVGPKHLKMVDRPTAGHVPDCSDNRAATSPRRRSADVAATTLDPTDISLHAAYVYRAMVRDVSHMIKSS